MADHTMAGGGGPPPAAGGAYTYTYDHFYFVCGKGTRNIGPPGQKKYNPCLRSYNPSYDFVIEGSLQHPWALGHVSSRLY